MPRPKQPRKKQVGTASGGMWPVVKMTSQQHAKLKESRPIVKSRWSEDGKEIVTFADRRKKKGTIKDRKH